MNRPDCPKQLILIRGLPGSGKSTIAKMLAENFGYLHLEADSFFEGPNGYKFDGSKIKEAHESCQRDCRRALQRGQLVVVANTFTQRWEMKPYLDMAEQYQVGVDVIVAKGNYQNVHGVPDEAIARMRARWED